MPGGRPPKWETKEELQELIDKYFLSLVDENGKYQSPPTITGLAIALGTNRETLCNYEEKDEFFDTVKEAKSRCEQWVEENALIGKANPTFSIFNLKNNYGWKDKTETDFTTNGKDLTPVLVEFINGKDNTDTDRV